MSVRSRFFGLLIGVVATGIGVTVVASADARATIIDVQFEGNFTYPCGCAYQNPQQSGAAVVGAPDDHWNNFNVAQALSQILLDVNGNASHITLSFTADFAYTANATFFAFSGQPDGNLMQGYLADVHGTDTQLLLAGLAPGQHYYLYVYTQGDDISANRSITLSATGATQQTSVQSNASQFVLGDNYLYFAGTADENGDVAITDHGIRFEGDINGFQLLTTDMAEPASLTVLAAALAGLGMARRRSSAWIGGPPPS